MVLPLYSPVNFGILGGLNFVNTSVEPDQGFDWKTRTVFGTGGVLDYIVTDKVKFLSSVKVSAK